MPSPLLRIRTLLLFTLPLVACCFDLPDPKTLWQGPTLNASDDLFAGLLQIEGVRHMLVYNGSEIGRTYSHHAIVEQFDGRLFAAWSSAANDEDSMGQQVWVSTAERAQIDGSWTWDNPVVAVPGALLPNQTAVGEQNYTFWCNEEITQRAMQPNTFVEYDESIYAIVEGADRYCWGDLGSGTHGPGRLAVQFSYSGKQLSSPCWLVQTDFTTLDLYSETALGTQMCPDELISGLYSLLTRPNLLPFSDNLLINNPKFAGVDGSSSMIEVTRAVWNEADRYWRRFWRDSTSSKTTFVSWVEYSTDSEGKDWFPLFFNASGANNINPTNIPDSNTKSFYGQLPDGRTYLVSNLLYHPTTKQRQPLCISIASDGVHFDWAGVLRTNASTVIIPDSRKIKRVGFSYPHATVVGEYMYVGYSEDKENIWITEVPLASLG